MNKLEYNPITGDLDKTGGGDTIFGMSWDDGTMPSENFEEMMERRVAALENAVAVLQRKTENL